MRQVLHRMRLNKNLHRINKNLLLYKRICYGNGKVVSAIQTAGSLTDDCLTYGGVDHKLRLSPDE